MERVFFIPPLIALLVAAAWGQQCDYGYYAFRGSCYAIAGSDNLFVNQNFDSNCINGACLPASTTLNNNAGFNCVESSNCKYPGSLSTATYEFTTSLCSQQSFVGTISLRDSYSYTMQYTTGYFYVTSNGQILMNTQTPPGFYYLVVTAYGAYGTSNIPVSITVQSC